MNELRPLLADDAASSHADLLRSAVLDEPPREGKARVLVALGLQTATLLGSGTVAAATSGAGSAILISKWVAYGMLAGFATTTSVQLIGEKLEPPAARRSVPAAAAPSPAKPRVVSAATARFDTPPAPVQEASAPERKQPRKAAAPRADAPVSARQLAAEVEALDRARRALDSRDAERALAALDAHAARFGTPRLAPEATVLRIEALIAKGQRERARELAERVLATQPENPHAARVRAIVQALAADRKP